MQEAFSVFITKISLFPTVIFTALVMFVTLYWIVSLLGMADMDTIDIGEVGDLEDLGEVGGGTDIANSSTTGLFTGLLLKFGLYGVPLIIILTLISLIGWVLSYLYTSFLHQRIDSGVLYYVFGTGAFLLVLVVSMWLTGLIISPIRKNIAQIPKRNASSNIGKTAVVRTLSVTENHGEAVLNDGGAGLILKVRSKIDSKTNNKIQPIQQGDRVVLVEYSADTNTYRVEPAPD